MKTLYIIKAFIALSLVTSMTNAQVPHQKELSAGKLPTSSSKGGGKDTPSTVTTPNPSPREPSSREIETRSPPVSPISVSDITVEVFAADTNTPSNAPVAYHVTAAEVLSSAGTYGDFTRYVQQFPGVVFNSDQSDDILVRGGHPMENLYLVDGFEVPNINHISTQGTTGGFASMIDTNVVGSLDFHTGGYDASNTERLSSVIEIHTRELRNTKRHMEGDIGITGAGMLAQFAIRDHDSLLMSAHRSLLNLF